MAGGHADPPMTTRFNVESFLSCACKYCSNPSHTVGTPLLKVTPSFSNSSHKLAPSSWPPGSTSLVPTKQAAYGKLQEKTWNIGVTGMVTSRADRPMLSGIQMAIACKSVERWEYKTPLGLPVVPEV